MRIINLILLTLLSHLAFSQDENTKTVDLQSENIQGQWILDLRPTPDAAPYIQSLFIRNQKNKNFEGTFYGSIIQDAYINTKWDKIYFAFKTSDQSSEYFQSGYIDGDEIFGMTYCPDRDFVMKWNGKKKEE